MKWRNVLTIVTFVMVLFLLFPGTKTSEQIYNENIAAVGEISQYISFVSIIASGSTSNGGGTAFFVSEKEPIILTARHVIAYPQDTIDETNGLLPWYFPTPTYRISYTFTDNNGKKYPAFLNWEDKENELALLTVAGIKEWKAVKIGTPKDIHIGGNAYLIGNPEGLEGSIAEGIISGLHRESNVADMIQTTCAVNPGNSGGPLFNEYGKVIGVAISFLPFKENISFCTAIDKYTEKDFPLDTLKPLDPFAPF